MRAAGEGDRTRASACAIPHRDGVTAGVGIRGAPEPAPAGGEGQLSSGGVRSCTRFVFVVWAEPRPSGWQWWVSGSREIRFPGDQIRATVKTVLREGRRSVSIPTTSLLLPGPPPLEFQETHRWFCLSHGGESESQGRWPSLVLGPQTTKSETDRQTELQVPSGKRPLDVRTSISLSFKYRPLHFYFSAFDLCEASEVNS